jgi:hypothetical protein
MRNGYSTAIVILGLSLVCLVGWAASHAPASAPAVSANFSPAPPQPTPSPVPACTASQLGLAYLAGQQVGINDFGIVAIWDKSSEDCSLTGALLVTGVGPAGRPVTQEYQVAASGMLTADGTSPGEGMQLSAGEHAAPLIVSAEYQLEPPGYHHRCTRPVEPASWRLTIETGGTLTVRNADPRATPKTGRGMPADHGLLTCDGQLDTPNPVVIPSPG